MRRAVVAVVLLALLVGAGGLLGARAYQDVLVLRQPAAVRTQDTSRIRGWMTVRFIAEEHRLAVDTLAAELGAPPGGDVTLDQLAHMRGVSPEQQLADARATVSRLQGVQGGG
ncbi:MAG TPA: hypothetical protein VGK33_08065 [Chloroflexota bacterium]